MEPSFASSMYQNYLAVCTKAIKICKIKKHMRLINASDENRISLWAIISSINFYFWHKKNTKYVYNEKN